MELGRIRMVQVVVEGSRLRVSQRLRAEVEAATRLAHQALEQDFSLKLKYLGESISNLVRMLFQTSTESKESK